MCPTVPPPPWNKGATLQQRQHYQLMCVPSLVILNRKWILQQQKINDSVLEWETPHPMATKMALLMKKVKKGREKLIKVMITPSMPSDND